jgi:hypothetical protein
MQPLTNKERKKTMTTYTVYFRTDAESASRDIKADTPEQALVFAQQMDAPGELCFDPHNAIMPVNEIVVCDPEGKEAAHWRDDDLRLRLAAGDLLEALEFIAADIEEGIKDKSAWLRIARAAIAKAKEGAA